MRIIPRFNNTSFINFKNNKKDQPYKYNPAIVNSPRRQAIENIYGKRLAELSALAAECNMSPREYELRFASIIRLKEAEIKALEEEKPLT